jgi:hypothetical protein
MRNADRINLYADRSASPSTMSQRAPAAANALVLPTAPDQTAAGQIKVDQTSIDDNAIETVLRETARLRDHLASQPATADHPEQRQLQRLLTHLNTTRQELLEETPEIGNRRSRQAALRRTRLVKLALAAAIFIIAAEGIALWWLHHQAEIMLGRPLTADTLITASSDDLSVTFRPNADSATIAHLLKTLHLRIVDGPTDDGAYILRPESGTDSVKALNALRDRRGLVYSAVAAD